MAEAKTYTIRVVTETRNAMQGIDNVSRNLRALGKIAFAGAIVAGLKSIATASIDANKQFQNMRNQLSLVTQNGKQLEQTLALLTGEAQKNRSSVADTVDLYSRLNLVTRDMGLTQTELLKVTSNFSKALAISGATTQEASGAMRQFGQAMGSPIVQAQEYNSILDAMGSALVFVAQDAGMTVGELTKLAKTQKLSSRAFLEMFMNTTSLNEAFQRTAVTTDQLEQSLSDAFDGWLAELPIAKSITEGYNNALKNAARRFNDLSGATERQIAAQVALRMEQEKQTSQIDRTAKAIASFNPLMDSATKVAEKFGNLIPGTQLDQAQYRLLELNNAMHNYKEASNIGAKGSLDSSETFEKLGRAIRATEEEIQKIKDTEQERADAKTKQDAEEKDRARDLLETRQRIFLNMQKMQAAEAAGTGYVEAAQQKANEAIREANEIFKDQITLQKVLQNIEVQRLADVKLGNEAALEAAKKLKQEELDAFISAEETKRNEALKTSQYNLMLQGMNAKDAAAAAQNIMDYEKDKTGFMIKQGANFFDAFKDQSKDAFNAYKAFSIAQTIMDTYKAAMAAYASLAPIPFVGPALGIAAAAAAIGFGMQQVNAIRSQTYSGRQFGGPVTGGSSYIVGERGPEIMTAQGNGTITPLNKAAGQTVNINFNIETPDTNGFDELLITRRPLIVGMVQEAMNRQGTSLA